MNTFGIFRFSAGTGNIPENFGNQGFIQNLIEFGIFLDLPPIKRMLNAECQD